MNRYADSALMDLAAEHRTRFFGKYRGTVKKVLDGKDLGKLEVSVPDVLGDVSLTAWPCVLFAGPSHGLVSLPESGDGVWVEFEGGDPAQPIWVGCWWGDGDMPSPSGPKVRSWITSNGMAIVMDEDGGELSLTHPDGPSITLSSDSITLSTQAASVTLDAQGISLKGNIQVSL